MYKPKLNIFQTQKAIADVKKTFQYVIENELNLKRVSAPLFVDPLSGLNDNLAENQEAVKFYANDLNKELEIVQSLAKWKRLALKKYGFKNHTGLYTDMNAIRKNEILDATHSLYVDQWDWEYIISHTDYNLHYLKDFINRFYKCIYATEQSINLIHSELKNKLPKKLFFITTHDLLIMYPKLSPKQREYEIVKEHKAVFIAKIGQILDTKKTVHDLRAPDYDNWELNGDLFVYHEPNNIALELMSMGIRVDKEALINQTKLDFNKLEDYNPYYQMILKDELPLTIGGGIGQSRLCMFLLEKVHIGEVQVSVWSEAEILELKKKNIFIL